MSNKNKLENKSARRSERANITLVDRTPVSPIAQKTSARILSNPKLKVLGTTRRRLQRSRGMNIDESKVLSGGTGSPPEVKVALKLESLPMVRLIRSLKKALRRSATIKYLLAALHPGSKFGPTLSAEQTHQLCLAKQVHAEILSRRH